VRRTNALAKAIGGLRRSCRRLAVSLLLGVAGCSSANYLDEMPTPQRVAREIQGASDVETALRQAAAFDALMDAMLLLGHPDGDRSGPLPPEQATRFRAYYEMKATTLARAKLSNAQLLDWEVSGSGRAFQREVIQKYLSPGTLKAAQSAAKAYASYKIELRPAPRTAVARGSAFDVLRVREVRIALQLSVACFGLLLLLGVYGEFKRVGLSPGEPASLQAGFRRYAVHSVTGMVRSPSQALESVTTLSGTAASYATSTETHVHSQFFIEHPGGEVGVQLVDVRLPLREGHRLSAVWAIRNGKARGPYIIFRNHTTNERIYIESALRRILRPRVWPLPVLVALVWAIALQAIPPGGTVDQAPVAGGIASALTFFTTIAWFTGRAIVGRLRVRRFKRNEAVALMSLLDARARDIVGGPGGWVAPV
jgi:hypothetical protein